MVSYDHWTLGSCGDQIAVSESVVAVSCFLTKAISIYSRESMKVIHERTFTLNDATEYGETLKLLSFEGGL